MHSVDKKNEALKEQNLLWENLLKIFILFPKLAPVNAESPLPNFTS